MKLVERLGLKKREPERIIAPKGHNSFEVTIDTAEPPVSGYVGTFGWTEYGRAYFEPGEGIKEIKTRRVVGKGSG